MLLEQIEAKERRQQAMMRRRQGMGTRVPLMVEKAKEMTGKKVGRTIGLKIPDDIRARFDVQGEKLGVKYSVALRAAILLGLEVLEGKDDDDALDEKEAGARGSNRSGREGLRAPAAAG